MLNLELISIIIGILGGTGLLVGGCGYAYSSWKKGANTYKDENIVDLKLAVKLKDEIICRLNDEKTELINTHQVQITDLIKQMATLKAQFDEQSKQLAMYSQIVENRDPETLTLLKEIKDQMIKMNAHQVIQEKNVAEVAEKAETVRTDLRDKKTKVLING